MNIATHDNRSKSEIRVDKFVKFFGSMKMIKLMTLFIIVWVTFNVLNLTNTIHFDKYPFILLNLLFSTQASYAAPLILLSQNRQAETDRLKAEHDFEVNQRALELLEELTSKHQ